MALPNLVALRRFAGVRPASMLALVWRPALGCFAMALVLGAVDAGSDVAHGPVALATRLASLVAAGALTYVGSVAAVWWMSGRPSGAEAYVLARLTPMLARGR
jgi:PST family polysaccharide transporter